jgi:hypothetical protein
MQRRSIQQVAKFLKASEVAAVPLGIMVTIAVGNAAFQAIRNPVVHAESGNTEKPHQHHHLFEHPTVEEMEEDAKTPVSKAIRSAANASFFADLHRYGIDDFAKFSC